MHDAAYKLLFSHPHMVADLLRGFLPDGAWPGFDFNTLEPLPASHVGRGFRRREGDGMWRLRARAAPDGGWIYVLLLMEFQSRVDQSMALRVLTYTGLALEGLLRWREGLGGEEPTGAPLPPVIPFVVYNGHPRWTAPPDVSELIVPSAGELARLQPSNSYVLLDMQRAETGSVPEDNAVGLQVALEQAMLEEKLPILRRVETVLAGPEHVELRMAFAAWLRRSWEEDYGVFADVGEALRDELYRMEKAGEVVRMGSLAVERWKERNRQNEARISARAMERGMEKGLSQGRAEGIEFHRRQLGSLAARRFGADAGERLSVLLAGVSEPERLAAVGNAIVDCGTGADLLAAVRRIVGMVNSAG